MPIEDLINSVQRMDLKPSSIIVISCEQSLTPQQHAELTHVIRDRLKLNNKVIILDKGLNIQIINMGNNESLADILIGILTDQLPPGSIDKDAFRKEALEALEQHTDPKIVKKG